MKRLIPSALWDPKVSAHVLLRQNPGACAAIWERAANYFRNDPDNEQKVQAMMTELEHISEENKGP